MVKLKILTLTIFCHILLACLKHTTLKSEKEPKPTVSWSEPRPKTDKRFFCDAEGKVEQNSQ